MTKNEISFRAHRPQKEGAPWCVVAESTAWAFTLSVPHSIGSATNAFSFALELNGRFDSPESYLAAESNGEIIAFRVAFDERCAASEPGSAVGSLFGKLTPN